MKRFIILTLAGMILALSSQAQVQRVPRGGGSGGGVTTQQLSDTATAIRADFPEGVGVMDSILMRNANGDTITLLIDADNNIVVISPPPPPGLRMVFDDIANASTMISGDATDVDDWNAFFGLANMTTPFSSVNVLNDTVHLFGADELILTEYLFGDNDPNGTSLLEINDSLQCIIECEDGVFSDYNGGDGCTELYAVSLPACVTFGTTVFADCYELDTINLPFSSITTLGDEVFYACYKVRALPFSNLVTMGNNCFQECSVVPSFVFPDLTAVAAGAFLGSGATTFEFPIATTAGIVAFSMLENITNLYLPACITLGSTTGNNNVFLNTTGETITITILHALESDGDIVYLKANNTVTVLYSD